MDIGPPPDDWYDPPEGSLPDVLSPLTLCEMEVTAPLAEDLGAQLRVVTFAWMGVKTGYGVEAPALLVSAYKASLEQMTAYWIASLGLNKQAEDPELLRMLMASCIYGMSETYKEWEKHNG